jgi:hypothetical protein
VPIIEMATNDERKLGLPKVEGSTPYKLSNCVKAKPLCCKKKTITTTRFVSAKDLNRESGTRNLFRVAT